MATFEETIEKAVQAAVKRALLDAHPVGSIYLTIKDENPSAKFGGTWEKLPASVCLQTADTSHGAGTTIAAGLPNITSEIKGTAGYGAIQCSTPSFSGAISGTYQGNAAWSGSTNGCYNIKFDASKSNSIYGKSTTVQPPAYALVAWRRTA